MFSCSPETMNDLIYVSTLVFFFVASAAFARSCGSF